MSHSGTEVCAKIVSDSVWRKDAKSKDHSSAQWTVSREVPEGLIELVDAAGTPYDLSGRLSFSLCRCGASVNKPFCDGAHSKIGFQAAEAAVRAEEKK